MSLLNLFRTRSRKNAGKEAILQSGAIRMRPIVLTALTTTWAPGPLPLTIPFFPACLALIFGLFASTCSPWWWCR
ncbi:MAG: hypothetical protein R2860_13810 [Desulfobacterales bacterium]